MSSRLRSTLLLGLGIILGILITVSWRTFDSFAQTPTGCQTFPQTNHKICGKFLTYWNSHGGLVQQGYPLSEEFVETSDLNGKPYTVQYFERTVFELHPENQPPFDVLLSQLGTYLGKQNYPQGFSNIAGEEPFYEIRDRTPEQALKSYYNAINRKEYERAYSYFRGAPNPLPTVAPPYPQFVAGYADTISVTLAIGKVSSDAGAGNIYATMPVVITAKHTDGSTVVFSGCYTLHRTNFGISNNPNDVLWSIEGANLAPAPANASIDQLLAQQCTR